MKKVSSWPARAAGIEMLAMSIHYHATSGQHTPIFLRPALSESHTVLTLSWQSASEAACVRINLININSI
jgi:hypothetical protein